MYTYIYISIGTYEKGGRDKKGTGVFGISPTALERVDEGHLGKIYLA